MSILLGPLSETISNVSWRDCALAGDQIAGAGSMPAPASAVIDFKNWRRFMWWTLPVRKMARGGNRKGHARLGCGMVRGGKLLRCI
jgi:hypothetical protein